MLIPVTIKTLGPIHLNPAHVAYVAASSYDEGKAYLMLGNGARLQTHLGVGEALSLLYPAIFPPAEPLPEEAIIPKVLTAKPSRNKKEAPNAQN